ncbi:MAG: hypothetical protein KAU48_14595, partial [Candidatus Thorarchaeota archaeon]|nr:hypothetical protein [Candidatus Thorarchaeota archaeon]
MQLDQFYISVIQITLMDAIAIGAGAGFLASTYFGIKLKRKDSNAFAWLFGGTAAIIIGTILGLITMNAVGYITVWNGSSLLGLQGADLTEWSDTIAAIYAPYQMQAAGFAMMGTLLGIGWGHGIGVRPDDTSLLGNIIATLAIIAMFGGFLLTMLPGVLTLSYDTAFLYLGLFNVLILLYYGIAYVVNQARVDVPIEGEESEVEV